MASKKTPIQRREDIVSNDTHQNQHQIKVSNALKIKLDHLKTFSPLTDNQKKLFDEYDQSAHVLGILGSAGTGKTFCILYKALAEVLDRTNSFKRVVIVRSCTPVKDVGFLPGSLEEKQEVYELPYKEIAATLFDRPDAYDRLKEQGYIRFISTTAIRGISIDDAIVIVDESAGLTYHELDSVITRVGYRSKIAFVGDVNQNDLIYKKHETSGLSDFIKVLRNMDEYVEILFTVDDIVRSSVVKNYILAKEACGIGYTI